MKKISRFCFERIASPIKVLCSNFMNLGDGKSVTSCASYLTKNMPGSPALATAPIAPKICQDQPQTMYSECSTFHPNWFTFGGVIRQRVNTIIANAKLNPILG